MIHHGSLGDVVLTFPAIATLKNENRRIDLVCSREIGAVARELGLVDNIYDIASVDFMPFYAAANRTAENRVFDMLRSYDDIIMFSVSEQLAQRIEHLSQRPIYRIPSRPQVSEKIHVGKHIFLHLKAVKLMPAARPFAVQPHENLQTYNFNTGSFKSTRIILHPGSGSHRKNWPFSNFLDLAARIKQKGLHPEFVFGPAEIELSRKLARAQTGPSIPFHVIADLHRMLILFQGSRGYVGNDSGITHLSAFTGVSTVAIFGPSDPLRWSPVGPAVRTIRAGLACDPCFESGKHDCDHMACLNEITPEQVLNELLQLIDCSA